MDIFFSVIYIILRIVAILSIYKVLYYLIGFFGKEKMFPSTTKKRKYAFVISARNESKVIGNLLSSIQKQKYPKDQYVVFVVADNCHDDTAKIALEHGAIVYERHDQTKMRKGYALEFLFENIQKDYGIDFVDGYIFFDADNLLDKNFLKKINDAFVYTKADAITGYKNTKNFDKNIISSAYGFHWYEQTIKYHRPRGILNSSTHIIGTGFMLSSQLLLNGWHYHCLTEDTQLTADLISQGKKVVFCEAANFYDEQPTNFFISIRQRLRWQKGRLFVFLAYGYKFILGFFKKGNKNRWACYDMFLYCFPAQLISTIIAILTFIVSLIELIINHELNQTISSYNLIHTLKLIGGSLLVYWISHSLSSIITAFRERKKIKCSYPKLILYIFTSFWFPLLGIPCSLISLFMKVKWKPIYHNDSSTIESLDSKKNIG